MANTVKESAISIKIAVFTIFLSVTSIILGGVTVDYVKPVVAELIGQQSVPPAAVMLQPQPRPVVESAPADKIAPPSELSLPTPQTVAPNSEPTLLAEPNTPVRPPAVVAPPAKAEPAPAVAAAPKASPLPVQSPKSATAKPAVPRAEAAPSPAQLRWEAPRVDPVPPAPTRRDGAERRVWERDLAEDAERRNVWRGERRGLERLRELRRRPDFPSPEWMPAPRLGREWQGQGRRFNPERFGRRQSRSERW
jgi:hypothetical protein